MEDLIGPIIFLTSIIIIMKLVFYYGDKNYQDDGDYNDNIGD